MGKTTSAVCMHEVCSVILKQILRKCVCENAEQIQMDTDDPTVGFWKQGNVPSCPIKAGNFKTS